MAKTKEPKKTFDIRARIVDIVTLTVEASTFQEALDKSKNLAESDFREQTVDDGSFRIIGIDESGGWNTD